MKIELKNLTLRYDDRESSFQDLNFVAESGDFVWIKGRSGSGKSSLLQLINRLHEPTSGEILIDDQPIQNLEITDLRRKICYLQQTPTMIDLSVEENLLFPFRFKSISDLLKPDRSELEKLLDTFLLKQIKLDDMAINLSIGEQQRLALIRALIVEPKILLCDEPTAALDPTSKEIVENAIEQLNFENGITIFLVSHGDYVPKSVDPKILQLGGDQ